MQIICRSLPNLLKGCEGDDVLDDDDDADSNNRGGDDDGLPAYSHNDRIPPWHGEMSVMIKVGMCQCQNPTIHHTP